MAFVWADVPSCLSKGRGSCGSVPDGLLTSLVVLCQEGNERASQREWVTREGGVVSRAPREVHEVAHGALGVVGNRGYGARRREVEAAADDRATTGTSLPTCPALLGCRCCFCGPFDTPLLKDG